MTKQEQNKPQQTAQNAPVTRTNAFYATQNAWWNQRNQAMGNIAASINYASPYNGR